jgi:hypothetical protein
MRACAPPWSTTGAAATKMISLGNFLSARMFMSVKPADQPVTHRMSAGA